MPCGAELFDQANIYPVILLVTPDFYRTIWRLRSIPLRPIGATYIMGIAIGADCECGIAA
jgi:hypothetical protein